MAFRPLRLLYFYVETREKSLLRDTQIQTIFFILYGVTKSKYHVTKRLITKTSSICNWQRCKCTDQEICLCCYITYPPCETRIKQTMTLPLNGHQWETPHSCISYPGEGGTCCLMYVNDIFHYDHIRSAAPCAENLSNYITNTSLYLDARLLLGASRRNKDLGTQEGEDIQNGPHTTHCNLVTFTIK